MNLVAEQQETHDRVDSATEVPPVSLAASGEKLTVLMNPADKGASNLVEVTLHKAADCQMLKPCKFLVDINPNLIATLDDKGNTPFWLACFTGKTELLPTLFNAAVKHFGLARAKEVTVNSRNQLGLTPLHHAAFNDFEGLAVWLVRHGADLDLPTTVANDNTPFTPLMMACKANSTRVAVVLYKAGVDLNLCGSQASDVSPLHIAIKGHHNDLAAYLYSKGARSACNTKRCIKCRMYVTLLKRQLNKTRERVKNRIHAYQKEAEKKKELEEIMKEFSFEDFQKEMRSIAAGLKE